MHISRNIESLSRTHCCHPKAISITYSDYVSVALFIPYVKCMRRIVLLSVSCLFLPYFPTFSLIDTIFGKRLLNIKLVLKLSTNVPEIFIIVRIIYRHIFINIRRSLCKVPIFVRFETKLNFLYTYSRKRYIKFKEKSAHRTELRHADRRTDTQTDRNNKAHSRYSQFYERVWKSTTQPMWPQLWKTHFAWQIAFIFESVYVSLLSSIRDFPFNF